MSDQMPPPPPPPPPVDNGGPGGVAQAESAWSWFRSLPWWGQALGWLFLLPVVLLVFALTKPAGSRLPWYGAAAAAVLIGVVAVATGGEEEPVEAAADETTTTAAERTTTTTEATTTSESTTTTSSTTTTRATATTTQPRPPGYISESTFEEPWPFSVSDGVVACLPGSAVVFGANGTTYAVNGLASGRAEDEGWSEIEEIWLENPAIEGTRINIGPVIDLGLELCD